MGGADYRITVDDNPGLNSGFMIPQYAAASMVSQNKMYCLSLIHIYNEPKPVVMPYKGSSDSAIFLSR